MGEHKILKNKWFLYLTEFFAGVSVMAVELGASRLLAPYFSSSQIVWTIIIGTIMIAMALGNLYGGRAADKNPDPARLYRRILIAAVWIAAIPVLGKYLIMGITGLLIVTISTNFLVIAAFVSCMLIFVFPLFLLGTVTPSLVKVTVDSLDDSGRTVGRLGACNTIGSILGTFLPTFVTIPAVGTAVTFLIFSGVLLAIALVYFLSEKTKLRAVIIAVILFLLCLIFGRSTAFAFWEDDLSYEGESVYNYLQVKEDDRQVTLSTNVLFGVQSVMMKEGGLTGMYYDYALAGPVMAGKDAPKVLVLGNGSGTFASQCLDYFPGCTAEGVEIDGKITQLAWDYFAMPEAVQVTEYDGRAYLQAIVNPADDINMRRILNVPKRGLGARAESQVTLHAQQIGGTFWDGVAHADQIEGMTARTLNPLMRFAQMMQELREFAQEHDAKPSQIVAEVLERSGLLEELKKSQDPQDQSRVENLSQLQSVAAEYEQNTPDATLAGFLETTALVADSDQLPDEY